MEKIMNLIRKIGKLVIVILSFAYAALFSVFSIGRGAAQGEFMPVLASLILMGVGTLAIASVGVLLLLNKETLSSFLQSSRLASYALLLNQYFFRKLCSYPYIL